MKYSLANYCRSRRIRYKSYKVEESELNYLLNANLDLTQDDIDFLLSTEIDLIPIPPHDINHRFGKIIEATIGQIIGEPPDSESHVSPSSSLQWDVCRAVIHFVKNRGDCRLRDCLSAEEIRQLPRGAIEEEQLGPEILRLSKIIPSLLLYDQYDDLPVLERLLPKGKAACLLVGNSQTRSLANSELRKPVSEHYNLPRRDSYQFLQCEYLTKPPVSPFGRTRLFDQYPELISSYRLKPMDRNAYFEHESSERIEDYHNKLVHMGIPKRSLTEIYGEYNSHVGRDFVLKEAAIIYEPAAVCGIVLQSEHPQLYESLKDEVVRLCDRILRSRRDPVIRTQAAFQLKASLASDLLLFSVFSNHIFDPKKMIAPMDTSRRTKQVKLRRAVDRRGRRYSEAKLKILPIIVPTVNLFLMYAIPYPYDEAARYLNVLSNEAVYLMTESSGYETKTSGGAVLRQDYRKLLQFGPIPEQTWQITR